MQMVVVTSGTTPLKTHMIVSNAERIFQVRFQENLFYPEPGHPLGGQPIDRGNSPLLLNPVGWKRKAKRSI